MAAPTRADLVRKIRELGALAARAGTSSEAAAALRKAAELAERYGLTGVDFNIEPPAPARSPRKPATAPPAADGVTHPPGSLPIRIEARIGRIKVRWDL